MVSASERRWYAIFKECDVDDDDSISRRELLVLLKRLQVDIPSDDKLDTMCKEIDEDENGEINYKELCGLIRNLGVVRTIDVAQASNSFRATLRAYLNERKTLVLWKDIFDRVDGFPRNGQIDSFELRQAFDQMADVSNLDVSAGSFTDVLSERIGVLMAKYDTDGDGQISFEEFKAKATDMVASGVQYERAVAQQGDQTALRAEAARRATLSNAQNVGLNASMMPVVEARLQAAFAASGTFNKAVGVLRVQDDLYRQFKIKWSGVLEEKYGQKVDDTLTAERVMLLDAIIAGDLDGIRALTQMDWNFVYPPAYVDPVSGERDLEAWCRTPLCLLVRPDEGNFDSKMSLVPEEERQALLQDVLSIGCADPNYPQIYWSSPAMHASFEGDLDALETLRLNGCDLRQKFEWVLQESPSFSLVHAAAFNGQEAVLRYLRTLYPPSFMREIDATGSNALHVTLDSSRDMGTARFLLEQNVDGFAFNQAGRSPLSCSIECLPELALFLLKEKSRFEYRWWGNDLFWFSFDGIILPLQNEQPLQVSDQNGDPTTIEQLIIRHERKKLLETPLMLDVIERKWRSFASDLYTARIVKFSAMLATVFAASVVEPGSVAFQACAVAVLATWGVNLQVQVAKMQPRRGEQEEGRWKERVLGELGPLGVLDVFHLVVLPVVIGLRLGDSIGLLQLADQFGASVAFFGGLLQITLALRLLTYVALFRVLGPLLVTVLAMVSDATRFLSVLGIVILGYANGFYSLIHSSLTSAEIAEIDFDYSYGNILSEMGVWLAGQPALDMLTPLSPETKIGAEVLFWTFLATAYFVLLNLLIAIFNSAYERVISNSISEWLFIRLGLLLEFEKDFEQPGVRAYYEQLEQRDGRRAGTAGSTITQE
jgi:Ca2+-binding EF-hand superfamily protein